MKSIVGYTGFVGSNLVQQTNFDGLFNSQNIKNAYGTRPELLVYAGVRAEKYLANYEPEKDYLAIKEAISNIVNINPAFIILISTIDVYPSPRRVNEDTVIDKDNLKPYGLHRFLLEEWVESNIDNHLIVRLPGLYGCNLKKNFIFDLITIIPSVLSEEVLSGLSKSISNLSDYYQDWHDGFYRLRGDLSPRDKADLKKQFLAGGFSAENFTDSRSLYQFYNLEYLWRHLETAMSHKISKINMATEPVGVAELYKEIRCKEFRNTLNQTPADYDIRTKHDHLFGGKDGYIFSKSFVIEDLKRFIDENREARTL
jgi:nucleoside-diphosphate-sugar epimerase